MRDRRSAALLVLPFFLGVCGIWIIADRVCRLTAELPGLLSQTWVAAGGAVLYVILCTVSCIVFYRRLTTELLLIVIWLVQGLCQANALYVNGSLIVQAAVAFMLAAAVTGAIAFACYMMYYRLEAAAAYVCGMIPLGLAGVYSLAVVAAVIE